MLSMDGDEVTFEQILEAHKGKPVLIDIWASWCKDCIAGFPKLKELQAKNTQMDYVFLSLDKEIDRWKNGIEKYALAGDHYYIKAGWKGDFCTSIDLDWIPRYILLDAKGKIKVYRAIETTDQKEKIQEKENSPQDEEVSLEEVREQEKIDEESDKLDSSETSET